MSAGIFFLMIVLIAGVCAFVVHTIDWANEWCALVFVTVCALGGYMAYLQAVTP